LCNPLASTFGGPTVNQVMMICLASAIRRLVGYSV